MKDSLSGPTASRSRSPIGILAWAGRITPPSGTRPKTGRPARGGSVGHFRTAEPDRSDLRRRRTDGGGDTTGGPIHAGQRAVERPGQSERLTDSGVVRMGHVAR